MDDAQNAVKALLADITRAYRTRDLDTLMECISQETVPTAYGTGADEKCVGRDAMAAQFRRDWDQSDEASFTPGPTTVYVNADTAWTMGDVVLAFRIGEVEAELPGRMTLIAVHENGTWRAAHWHLSVAAAQDDGESFMR